MRVVLDKEDAVAEELVGGMGVSGPLS